MFTFGKGRKEEPGKPEFVDLAAIRAARPPAEQPARVPVPPNPLGGYLGHPHRPGLPDVDLAREHDAQLAKLVEQAQAADGEAVHLQIDWERHQPGSPGFNDVVAQDNAWASGYVKAGREIPHDAGPLHLWLTEGQHQLFVAAVHARLAADHADLAVREYAATSELRDRLDQAADEVQEEIRVLLVECKDEKSERAYQRAQDLNPSWNKAASLYEWAMRPTVPYRRRNPQAFPAELDVEEFQAATIGLGETRYEAPDRLTGVPSTIVTPGAKSSDRGGDSGKVNWGPEGPPGSRRAPGVT